MTSAETALPPEEARFLHKPFFIAFLCLLAANLVCVVLSIEAPWLEAILVIASALTVLVGLARRLPIQNVVVSTALIVGLAGVAISVSQKTGIPFGPRMFTENIGWKIFDLVPWSLPLIWLVAIMSSRGVARLIVRPWRKTSHYGFWVIGLTILFALVFDLGLEPYAAVRKHFWLWQAVPSVWNWHTTPWTNFLGWAVIALAIAVVATPWLINKNPVKQPTDYHPLVVWTLLNVYFATANAMQQYWVAVAVCALACVSAMVFAVRGARW